MGRKKVLNYRNATGIAPNPDNIEYGEIAIGYKKDNEAIYIKNSADDIVSFTSTSIVKLTYNELKELRDNSKLKPSQYYRITDFVTTVANDPEAQSAGHPFDIIVLASEKNKLQEECYAIQHEGDRYFANCNLAAWKIWYCLDNDNTKYAWADTVNGKGVIYRMIDECQNDCPYDFKNVQFKRYWANGTNVTKKEGKPKKIILQGYYGTLSNKDIFTEGIDTNNYLFLFTFTRLNETDIYYGQYGNSVTQSNVLDDSIYDFTTYNHFDGNRCRNNIFKSSEKTLRVNYEKYMSSILLNNVFITTQDIDTYEYYSSFNNTFGASCVNNTFGSFIYGQSFSSKCSNNAIDYYSNKNTFGEGCSNNTLGSHVSGNTFGEGCSNNTLGSDVRGNTFGKYCRYNTFGEGCSDNTFESDCENNTFGERSINNTFGGNCSYNTFGNYSDFNVLGNDVQYVEITTDRIYHTHILNGTKGTMNKKLTIEFTPNTAYSQFAGLTSQGVLETWVEADTPHYVVDGGTY